MEHLNKTSLHFNSVAEIIEARRAVYKTYEDAAPLTDQLDEFLGHVVIDRVAPNALTFGGDEAAAIVTALKSEAAKDDGINWEYAMAKSMLGDRPNEHAHGDVPHDSRGVIIITEDELGDDPEALRAFAQSR
jgi:hypothetical protein